MLIWVIVWVMSGVQVSMSNDVDEDIIGMNKLGSSKKLLYSLETYFTE